MNRFKVLIGIGSTTAVSLAAATVRADYDVSPALSGGQIVTNAFSDATEDLVPNVRVFDFGFDDPGPPLTTQDPGFHPQPGSGFPAGSKLTVSALSGLSYWSGSGNVAFGAVVNNEMLNLAKGSSNITVGATAPSGSVTVEPNFPVSGEADDHLQSTILAGTDGTDVPTDGIYLVELKLHESDASIGDSLPFFIVYNNGLDDSVSDAAKEYLRDNFAPGTNLAPLPEPSVMALGAIPVLGLCRRRRQALR